MKKVFLSLALLSASAVSMMAQNPAQACTNPEQCAKQEQCVNPDNCQNPEKCASLKRGGKGRDSKAFEGINLTEDQKTKLAALKKDNCTAKYAKREKVAPKDSLQKEKLTKEQIQQMRKERAEKHQNARKEYLVQVKEILTPDQYVMFLENCYTLQDDNAKAGQMNKGGQFSKKFDGKKMAGKGGKKSFGDMRDAKKAARAQKAANAQNSNK